MYKLCLCYTVLSVHCSLVATCWVRAGIFALLCVMCFVLSLSHMVSCVRCGIWLYRFLDFAFFLSFTNKKRLNHLAFFEHIAFAIEKHLEIYAFKTVKVFLYFYEASVHLPPKSSTNHFI